MSELRGAGHRIDEATLAVPGLVDPTSGMVVVAPNLGWEEIDTARSLVPRLTVRVDGSPVALATDGEVVADALRFDFRSAPEAIAVYRPQS